MRTCWAVATVCAAILVGASSARAEGVIGPQAIAKQPVAYGSGGGAATMSSYATKAAVDVLKQGGDAADAAVAAAATLGVTEPFVAGPGGGGYFVYYSAKDRKVYTIDGREKAPAGATPTMFQDANGTPLPFETAVESGVSVGVPGQVATWGEALDRFGTKSLKQMLKPAEDVARKGFYLDAPLVSSIQSQQTKLAHFPYASQLYLPGGKVPAIGTVLRNPDLAETYQEIGDHNWRWFYTGPIGRELAAATRDVQTSPGTPPVKGGTMTSQDMANYTAPFRQPLTWRYRGYQLYGMPPSTSGGTTVAEAMNILSNFDQSGDRTEALYRYLEASKLAYADRNQYVGDTDFVHVPVHGLISEAFGAERAKLIGPTAAKTPVAPGNPWKYEPGYPGDGFASDTVDTEQHTNHLVVADKQGDVVSYTNTIEQIAGSGILLKNRGFLLNNELTDFNFATGTANSVQPNKRPRSSMSPTLLFKDGEPIEAIGSPGGATIITTVLQTLLNQIDFGMSLTDAIEAPRASQQNGATTSAEPAFIAQYGPALQAKGEAFSSTTSIGIAAGLVLQPHGKLETATEAWRGGGGSAMVVTPENPEP